jgi:hypothetical protein
MKMIWHHAEQTDLDVVMENRIGQLRDELHMRDFLLLLLYRNQKMPLIQHQLLLKRNSPSSSDIYLHFIFFGK